MRREVVCNGVIKGNWGADLYQVKCQIIQGKKTGEGCIGIRNRIENFL